MGFRSQSGSRRGAGQRFQKSQHEKAKAKGQKRKSDGKYLPEETSAPSPQGAANKALSGLSKLGTQTFALSPFSQYFDDWLVNLRNVLSEFESNPAISEDDQFIKDRSQIFLNAERELAEKRFNESALEEAAKTLSEENHRLVEIDAKFASKIKEIAQKRNSDIESLNKNVGDFEKELERTNQMKTSFFGFTKKAKARKQEEITRKLNAAKSELELAVQNFTVEQEKLHDEYEKSKQAVIEKVQNLEKTIEKLETDSSLEARQAACNALANAVNALLLRKPSS